VGSLNEKKQIFTKNKLTWGDFEKDLPVDNNIGQSLAVDP